MTGVQTCALPICDRQRQDLEPHLQRQLEMRFEVLTLTVAHASFADASAVLDGEVARWPTDPYGRPVDEHAPQVAEGGGR